MAEQDSLAWIEGLVIKEPRHAFKLYSPIQGRCFMAFNVVPLDDQSLRAYALEAVTLPEMDEIRMQNQLFWLPTDMEIMDLPEEYNHQRSVWCEMN